MSVEVKAHPSLALIKYWGKKSVEDNTPATPSLALNLEAFVTKTRVKLGNADSVSLNGKNLPLDRFLPFFNRLRNTFAIDMHFSVESENNFPTAAGLASSSSGFAALALACTHLIEPNLPLSTLSDFARTGSASAARALFSGFTVLEKGAKEAKPLFPSDHWPELRLLIAVVKSEQKKISSRDAMQRSAATSPFYPTWIAESESLFTDAKEACRQKDLSTLGPIIQKSYLQMFSTLFTATPPIFYWEPETLSLLKACEKLRNEGFSIWETMDAGPQVKMLCLESELDQILQKMKNQATFYISKVGGGAEICS